MTPNSKPFLSETEARRLAGATPVRPTHAAAAPDVRAQGPFLVGLVDQHVVVQMNSGRTRMGTLKRFDTFAILLLEDGGAETLIYKHSVESITAAEVAERSR